MVSTSRPTSLNLMGKLSLSPEERLLVICARLRLSPDQREELEALVESPLRWDQILHRARWHLFPLLFHHLQGLENKERMPSSVRDWLKNAYLANVGRSLYFRAELKRVLEALKARDIPVIVLKGAALAETVYGCSSLRPMTDLDLLVRHEDADTADSIVRGMGYIPSVGQEVQEEMRARDRQLARLAQVGKPVIFDIHSHIVEADNPLRFDIAGFWQRAVPTPMAGVPSLVLAPEDLLIHLAVNFFKDLRFNSLSALAELCDIAETARFYSQQLDWDLFTREVDNHRLNGPVFCALYLAQQVSDAPIPDDVLEKLEPAGFDPREAERLARQRVMGDKWVAKALVDPGTPYSWRALAWGMLRRAFPNKQSLADHYGVPVQSRGVNYLYFRRWGEAISTVVRLITRSREMRNDLAVDRWLHSLYGDRGNGKANPDVPK